MKAAQFVHLHLHSEYSLLDGACRFDALTKRVAELGMPAVACTDHGNLFGVVPFYDACKNVGVKPIIGAELYITAGSRHQKGGQGGRRPSANHILILAENDEGYRNLCKLSSIGYLEGFYGKPRIDFESLQEHSKGLIVTTGCLKGLVPEAILQEDLENARRYLGILRDIMGPENLYVELMDHGISAQRQVLPALVDLARREHLRLVATNDCHYLTKADAQIHDVLLCIQTGATLAMEDRMRYVAEEFYVKTPEEMYHIFRELPEACRETLAIAERCNVELQFGQKLLPVYTPPDGSSPEDYLRRLAWEGLQQRYREITDAHKNRLEMELDTIIRMGFASYFLVVWDFVHYAKVNGIPVGPGRGSAAGALVSYCLGITDIDPLAHNLLFERFLNPERVSMPDIDIDFCFEKRGKVIEYVRRKYGERNVAQIITFGTLKPKNAVRDVGRVLGVDLNVVDKIAKLIPDALKPDKGEKAIDKALRESPELKKAYEHDSNVKRIIDYAREIEGMSRHASTHAAGIVICDRDLTDVVPLYKAPDTDEVVVQFPMTIVERIGLLKMDFLGLKNLTIIDNTLKSIRKNYGIEIDWQQIGLDDPETYKLLQEGRTLGVFQLESEGMTRLVRELRPTCFDDLVALLALYRPGPLGTNMHIEFVECKHGRKQVVFDHPALEPILRETYGMILYQEQVMQIAQTLAGFSLGQADLMRRAMGKKKKEEMEKIRRSFIAGAEQRGVDPELAARIFEKIEYFAGYGFNKSHSAAYAILSYRTAYLKAHFPVDYLAALMTNAIGDKVEEMEKYFAEARDLGVEVLPPDINESDARFTVTHGNIRFGLAAVKNVGEAAVEAIIAAREKGGPFRDFMDFCARVDTTLLNSRMLEALIKVGAFDSLGLKRRQLLNGYKACVKTVEERRREEELGQGSLFDLFDSEEGGGFDEELWTNPTFTFADAQEFSEKERYAFEKELLGYYVTGHPMRYYEADVEAFATGTLGQILSRAEVLGDEVRAIGWVEKIETKLDRNGNTMAFVTISDKFATLEAVVFASVYEKCKECEKCRAGEKCGPKEGEKGEQKEEQHDGQGKEAKGDNKCANPPLTTEKVVFLRGRLDCRNGKPKLLVDSIKPIAELREKEKYYVNIKIKATDQPAEWVQRVFSTLENHRGAKRVRLSLSLPQHGELVAELPKTLRVAVDNNLLRALYDIPVVTRVAFDID